MSAAPPPDPSPPGPSRPPIRIRLPLGETVAVLGLILAAAGFFFTRADRVNEGRAKAEAEQRTAQVQARASALVLRGQTDEDGAHIWLTPVDDSQVVQSQRYVFPRAVRETARQITAGRPQIDRLWFEDALKDHHRELARAGVEPTGEQRLPVALVTTFIDDGETRTDQALYQVGYVLRRGALGRSSVQLQGVSLLRRLPSGDPQAAVDAQWAAQQPASP